MSQPDETGDNGPESEADPSKSSNFQFRLTTIMFVTALLCVLAALFGGFFRNQSDGEYKVRFILLTLIVPTGLVAVISLARWLFGPRRKQRRRRPRW